MPENSEETIAKLQQEKESLALQLRTLEESLKPIKGFIEVAGQSFKYVFPSIFVARAVANLGFGGSFEERFEKAKLDDTEFQKMIEQWPLFIKTVIEGDSTAIDSLSKITYGEALSIHLGFTVLAWEVRKNSKPGQSTSVN